MKEQILNLRDKGYTYRQIAKELKCSCSTVYRTINPNGTSKENLALKLPKIKRDKIRELAEQGVQPHEILKQVGVSYTSYQKYGKPYQKNKFDGMRDIIISMRKQGKKSRDVAAELGVSTSYVFLQSKGITLRRNYGSKKDDVIKLFAKGILKTDIAKQLGISYRLVNEYTKGMKKIKKKEVKATPTILDQRSVIGKGVEAGVYTTKVTLRDNRDEGRLVKLLYSDLTDNPCVSASIRVKDDVSDEVAVERWAKKNGKKSWRVVV